jgi:hypothetical protein
MACAALTSCVGATGVAVAMATAGTDVQPPPPLSSEPVAQPREQRTPDGGHVRIAWVGDTMFGHAGASPPPDDGDALFAGVRDDLRRPDLTFGNLEGVLATGGASKCGTAQGGNCYAFRADPRNARALARAGFDVVNLANNHAWDYGAQGQAETIAALDQHEVAHTGLPGQVTVLRRNGTRVAFVGFAPYPWSAPLLDIPVAADLVKRADAQADVVVVAVHAGAEGVGQTHTPEGREFAFGEDRGETRAFAHAVVDAGADLVVGSGPHVVRGIERYEGRVIAYSLGNFAGWHNFGSGGAASLTGILDVTLGRDGRTVRGGVRSMTVTPPGVPGPDRTGATARLMTQLSAEDFGPTAAKLDADGDMER